MKNTLAVTIAVLALAALVAVGVGQEGMGGADSHGSQMPMFKPGKEQEGLRKMVGKWTTEMAMSPGPGMPEMISKGTSEISMVGEYWCLEKASYDMMGQQMTGIGIYGYDIVKKAHTATWVDSFAPYAMEMKGDMVDGKLVMTTKAPDMMMNPDNLVDYKMVESWTDDDTRVMEMHSKGPDGADVKVWTLTARRVK